MDNYWQTKEEACQHKEFLDNIKEGDTVAIRCKDDNYRRSIVYYRHYEIVNITPKRTKITFKNGHELERHNINQIHPATEETKQVEKNYNLRCKIKNILFAIDRGDSECHALSYVNFRDEDLRKAYLCIEKLHEMLKKELK